MVLFAANLAGQTDAVGRALDSLDDALYAEPDLPLIERELDRFAPEISSAWHPELIAKYYFIRGEAAYFAGDLEAPIRYYRQADSTLAVLGDSTVHRWVRVKDRLAGRLSQVGRFPEATEQFLEGIELAEYQRDSAELLELKTELAGHYSRNLFFDLAEQELRNAEQLAIARNNWTQALEVNLLRMMDASRAEDTLRAFRQVQKVGGIIKRLDRVDPRYLMFYYSVAVEIYALRGFTAQIDRAYRQADSLARGPLAGNSKFLINARYAEAVWHAEHGRFARANELADGLVAESESQENTDYRQVAYRLKYCIARRAGDWPVALNYSKRLSALERELLNHNRTAQIQRYRELFEREQEEGERLRQEREIARVREASGRRLRWVGGGLSAGLLSLLIIYLWRRRQAGRELLELQRQHTREIISTTSRLRRKIAMDLHDSVGQNLVVLRQLLRRDNSDPGEREELVEEVIDKVRGISREVYNTVLDQLGLPFALQQLLDQLDRSTDLFINADIQADELTADPETEQHFYAIAQEALQNVIKHARATAVRVRFSSRDGKMELLIEDNGIGLGKHGQGHGEGLGMYSMRERATIIGAKLRVGETHTGGTIIRVTKEQANE